MPPRDSQDQAFSMLAAQVVDMGDRLGQLAKVAEDVARLGERMAGLAREYERHEQMVGKAVLGINGRLERIEQQQQANRDASAAALKEALAPLTAQVAAMQQQQASWLTLQKFAQWVLSLGGGSVGALLIMKFWGD